MGRSRKYRTGLSLPKGEPRNVREARARETLYTKAEPFVASKSKNARGIFRSIIQNAFTDRDSLISKDVPDLNPNAIYSLLPLHLLKNRSKDLSLEEIARRLKVIETAQHLPKVIGFGIDHAIPNINRLQLIPDEETSNQLTPELKLIQGFFPSEKDEIFIPKLTLSTSRDPSFIEEAAKIVDSYAASHPGNRPITLGKIEIEI